jgi:dolichyl-phosphate-mannose-protein mannosyltransferase
MAPAVFPYNSAPSNNESVSRLDFAAAQPVQTDASLRWSRTEKIFVFLALTLLAALSIGSIRTESVTMNEILFIPTGVTYLQRHDARMDIEEPPLVKLLVGAVTLFAHPKIDYNDPVWTRKPGSYEPEYLFGQKFFDSWNPHADRLLFLSRLPAIGLTLLLGLSLYAMARRLAGPWGAALVLTVFSTSPFFIAYGSIVHMDVPIALFVLWATWYFASLWQRPTKRNALMLALSLAGALLTKFSAVFLLPAMFLAWAWFRYAEWRPNATPAPVAWKDFHREKLMIGAAILAGILVYAFYFAAFYRSNPRVILQNEFDSLVSGGMRALPIDVLVRRMTHHPVLNSLLLPPALYAGGLAYVVGHEKRPVYILGHWHAQGVWFYFPVLSFFKLAPGMLALLAMLAGFAAILYLGNRRERVSVLPHSMRFHLRAILVSLAVFAGIAMSSKLNVGIRHFSVPIAFGVLLCGLVVPFARTLLARRLRTTAFAATAALAFSCLLTAAFAYPHYLSYYNIFRLNTPKQEIAMSSNLSWGQSMPELAEFFRGHDVENPYVDTRLSPVDPGVYVAGARDWQCDKPSPIAPEWVAVSTSNLVREAPTCSQLMHYPSWDIGDGSVVVFHIGDSTVAVQDGGRVLSRPNN